MEDHAEPYNEKWLKPDTSNPLLLQFPDSYNNGIIYHTEHIHLKTFMFGIMIIILCINITKQKGSSITFLFLDDNNQLNT